MKQHPPNHPIRNQLNQYEQFVTEHLLTETETCHLSTTFDKDDNLIEAKLTIILTATAPLDQ